MPGDEWPYARSNSLTNGNEHVAPLSHLCAPLIRGSEYSHADAFAYPCISLKLCPRVKIARDSGCVIGSRMPHVNIYEGQTEICRRVTPARNAVIFGATATERISVKNY